MGERVVRNDEVVGSIPIDSTNIPSAALFARPPCGGSASAHLQRIATRPKDIRAMRLLALAAALTAIALPAVADSTSGTILAFDRVERIIVMTDKTVWELPQGLELPEKLMAGDRITIDFDSNGDSGVGSYNSITRDDG